MTEKSLSIREFYRVELNPEQGIYYSALFNPWASETYLQRTSDNHVMPHSDILLRENMWDLWSVDDVQLWHRFGFSDLQQLKAWIDTQEMRDTLCRLGLKLVRLHAEGVYGSYQAIFDSRTRIDLETLKLSEV